MRVPYELPCSYCSHRQFVQVKLHQGPHWTCKKCDESNSPSFDKEITIGDKLLQKSAQEFGNEDYPLSIVFSAMAFECEIAHFAIKWNKINGLDIRKEISDDDTLKELRKIGNIEDKILEVSKLMIPDGIQTFIKSNMKITEELLNFPSLSGNIAKKFSENLFWLRNSILHAGKSDYKKEEAAKAYSLAAMGIRIFKAMDEHKSAMP